MGQKGLQDSLVSLHSAALSRLLRPQPPSCWLAAASQQPCCSQNQTKCQAAAAAAAAVAPGLVLEASNYLPQRLLHPFCIAHPSFAGNTAAAAAAAAPEPGVRRTRPRAQTLAFSSKGSLPAGTG